MKKFVLILIFLLLSSCVTSGDKKDDEKYRRLPIYPMGLPR